MKTYTRQARNLTRWHDPDRLVKQVVRNEQVRNALNDRALIRENQRLHALQAALAKRTT